MQPASCILRSSTSGRLGHGNNLLHSLPSTFQNRTLGKLPSQNRRYTTYYCCCTTTAAVVLYVYVYTAVFCTTGVTYTKSQVAVPQYDSHTQRKPARDENNTCQQRPVPERVGVARPSPGTPALAWGYSYHKACCSAYWGARGSHPQRGSINGVPR